MSSASKLMQKAITKISLADNQGELDTELGVAIGIAKTLIEFGLLAAPIATKFEQDAIGEYHKRRRYIRELA